MGTEQSQQLKSILLINDYHILCKLRNPIVQKRNLSENFFVRKYLKF